MNIFGLTNHIKYENIFKDAKVNGKISWLKISVINDLPEDFIEQYFSKLKKFGIEKNQKLSDELIVSHKNELNWYLILKNQNLSEDCIRKCIDKIEKLNIWPLLFKTQALSLNFLLSNLSKLRENEKNVTAMNMNGSIPDDVKNKINELVVLT